MECTSLKSLPKSSQNLTHSMDVNDTMGSLTLPEIQKELKQNEFYLPSLTGDIITSNHNNSKRIINSLYLNNDNIDTLVQADNSNNRGMFNENIHLNKSFNFNLNINNRSFNNNINTINMTTSTNQANSLEDNDISDQNIKSTQEVSSTKSKSMQSTKVRPGSPYTKFIRTAPARSTPCPKSDALTSTRISSNKEKGNTTELPKSVIYLTRPPGLTYRLEFQTSNVSFVPLYVHPRPTPPLETEKKIQLRPYEYPEWDTSDVGKSFGHGFLRRKYALSIDSINLQKSIKLPLPSTQVYTDDVKSLTRKRTVSESNKSALTGHIYFNYRDMIIRVPCEALPITQIKMPVHEDILAKLEKLHMPTSETRRNKGVIIARYGNDLLQFNFKMEELNLSRYEVKGTAAVQTEDKMVYIREKSQISGRTILIAVPETTYFYKNPMDNIHRLHLNFQGSNIMPLWKYQMMKSRLAERDGLKIIEAKIDDAFRRTRGSRLCFDGLDAMITVQTGMLCCDIPHGYNFYESMMFEEYNPSRYKPNVYQPKLSQNRKSDTNQDAENTAEEKEVENQDVIESGAK
uniref:Uncharacterized protein n=1 Tax=Trichobilharzia regenti TaxID=157069 RepID=A0AA85K8I1_TRIRE|nr:unnamed protein product [Trichobilharzia regenti]